MDSVAHQRHTSLPQERDDGQRDNWEQPDTFVYLHSLRLTQLGAIQRLQAGSMNEFRDQKREPTPALIKPMTSEIQQVSDMPRL